MTRDYLAPVHPPRPRLTLAQLVGAAVLVAAAGPLGFGLGWAICGLVGLR